MNDKDIKISEGFENSEFIARFFSYKLNEKQKIISINNSNYYICIINYYGEFQIIQGGRIFNFNKNDVAVFRPFEDFEIIGLSKNQFSSLLVFVFHQNFFAFADEDDDFLRAFDNREKGKYFLYKSNDFKDFSFDECVFKPLKKYNEIKLSMIHFKAVLIMLISHITLIFDEKNDYISSEYSADYQARVFSYISSNFCNNITIEEISKKFHVSKVYINNVTKKFYSHGFFETINSLRMYHAVILMKKNTSFKEIAKLCGYADYSGFYKSFTKFFNQTPKEYYADLQKLRKTNKLRFEN